MTNDIVPAEQQSVEPGTTRPERTPQQAFQRTVIKAIAISVPVAVAFFIGLIAIAVARQHQNWTAMIAVGVGLGVLAGVFFGLLAAFVSSSELFD
ncbi:MAG: hypothetical protein ACLPVY_07540 [Acidimicrobiia bacterium]